MGLPVEIVRRPPPGLFATKTPQGVVALARRPRPSLAGILARRPSVVVLDSVRDPANVGAIVRTAAAAGVGAVIATKGTADPWSDRAVRASVGAVFALPVAAGAPPAEVEAALRRTGYDVAVADPRGDVDHRAWNPTAPWALVLGGEAAGASHAWAGAARVRIEIALGAESLAVAAAAAIMLFR